MTLEGLIEYEENASKATWNGKPTLCAEEHRQLAEWLKDYKRLLAQQPCGDCISRQAVLDLPRIKTHNQWGNVIKESVDVEGVRQLPPVTPQPKIGYWIIVDKGLIVTSYKCSECGRTVRDDTGYDVIKDYPYCHCGAKMGGE